jgi:hypothetical protein
VTKRRAFDAITVCPLEPSHPSGTTRSPDRATTVRRLQWADRTHSPAQTLGGPRN